MISGLATLRGYQRAWLRGDLVAGVTVAAYLIPQVMAYATVAGLPPVAGLMGLAAAVLRLGFVADLLSRPVLVGYMAGVGFIMIADQLRRVTGVPVTGQEFFVQLASFALGIGSFQAAPAALPAPALPGLSPHVLRELLLPAFTVLIVGFSDDVLTARSFAASGERIIPNRELLALGVANVGASLLRGFPVSSSATRTAIAKATGGRSQGYSLTYV